MQKSPTPGSQLHDRRWEAMVYRWWHANESINPKGMHYTKGSDGIGTTGRAFPSQSHQNDAPGQDTQP